MDNTIKITIVEDDFIISNFIAQSLTQIGYGVLDICSSYDQFVASLTQAIPDLVLFDIKIDGEKTGIDAAGYLKEKGNIPFVFISSLNDRKSIDDAKRMRPSAYLIKPFDEDDLYAAIEIALYNHAGEKTGEVEPAEETIVLPDFIFIKRKQAFVKIAWKDIIYVEAVSSYIKLFTQKEVFTLRQSMQALEKSFPSFFYRVHRSYLVNLLFAQTIEPGAICLPDNLRIPISRDTYGKLLESIQTISG